MTGRPAAACALYAAFLAAWAFGAALLRRQPSPYLLLGMGLLEAALLLGGLLGAAGLPGMKGEVAVHAGYLIASVAILPIGWLLARLPGRRLDPATLTVALVALSVVILRVDATAAG